jgi:hypothetical protein
MTMLSVEMLMGLTRVRLKSVGLRVKFKDFKLAAGGGLAFAMVLATPVAAAEFLGPDRLKAELGGHTIKGYYTQTRVNFVEVYLADGRITYKDDLKADAGRWTVRGTAFCTFYDQITGGCWYVVKRSANCFEFHLAPVTGDDIDREVLARQKPHALAARDSDKVTCDAWLGA